MNEQILVVDDDNIIRKTLTKILEHVGYQVTVVQNGYDALSLLQNKLFDLVILDIMMEGLSGIDVLKEMADLYPDTQIIMLTAHGSMETAVEALRFRVHDYLLKPSSPEKILNSVRKAFLYRNENIAHRTIGQSKISGGRISYSSHLIEGNKLFRFEENVLFDLDRRTAQRNSEKVYLTPSENRLMKVFLENPGVVLTHKALVSKVQGYDSDDEEAPEILRPLISRLRRKLTKISLGRNWIISVRGTGYFLEGAVLQE